METKCIVITGVSHGLGRALAELFARKGYTVIGCGRTQERLTELQQDLGGPHVFSAVDVSSDQEVRRWAAETLASSPPPDLLINNAAVIHRNARLWDISAREFSQVIDVNLKGVANVLRHFLPAMIQRHRGVVVNFSSGWGRSTDAEVAPYCASKWGIEGLTLALAQELPRGMAAVPLNPGIINTRMLQSCFGESAASYKTASAWAQSAVPFLLQLGPKDNGKQLEVP
jgi:NAD(P)-dependent dehydrogenase (short-subunit alcohol dehydrogenase family)